MKKHVKGKPTYGNNFQSTYTAAKNKRIEVVAVLYKENRSEMTLFDFSPWSQI